MHHKVLRLHTHTGDHVLDQPKVPPSREKPMYNGHRADIHRVFLDYADSLGIQILLGKRISEYSEDPASGKSWVTTEEGEIFKGDVVVGADGVRSRARKLVLGYDDKPRSSGYAVYRAWFNAHDAAIDSDPLTREFVANGDTHTGCSYHSLPFLLSVLTPLSGLGPDVHLLVATCRGGKELSWVCTHKVSRRIRYVVSTCRRLTCRLQDDGDIDESWSFPGRVDDALKLLDGWDPRCRAIVSRMRFCASSVKRCMRGAWLLQYITLTPCPHRSQKHPLVSTGSWFTASRSLHG